MEKLVKVLAALVGLTGLGTIFGLAKGRKRIKELEEKTTKGFFDVNEHLNTYANTMYGFQKDNSEWVKEFMEKYDKDHAAIYDWVDKNRRELDDQIKKTQKAAR